MDQGSSLSRAIRVTLEEGLALPAKASVATAQAGGLARGPWGPPLPCPQGSLAACPKPNARPGPHQAQVSWANPWVKLTLGAVASQPGLSDRLP